MVAEAVAEALPNRALSVEGPRHLSGKGRERPLVRVDPRASSQRRTRYAPGTRSSRPSSALFLQSGKVAKQKFRRIHQSQVIRGHVFC